MIEILCNKGYKHRQFLRWSHTILSYRKESISVLFLGYIMLQMSLHYHSNNLKFYQFLNNRLLASVYLILLEYHDLTIKRSSVECSKFHYSQNTSNVRKVISQIKNFSVTCCVQVKT